MSYEDLEKRDIFLPSEQRGELERRSSARPPLVGGILAVGILGCATMVWNGGGAWTWVGSLLFVASLLAFTLQADAAIDRQCRRVDRLLAETDQEGDGGGAAS